MLDITDKEAKDVKDHKENGKVLNKADKQLEDKSFKALSDGQNRQMCYRLLKISNLLEKP